MILIQDTGKLYSNSLELKSCKLDCVTSRSTIVADGWLVFNTNKFNIESLYPFWQNDLKEFKPKYIHGYVHLHLSHSLFLGVGRISKLLSFGQPIENWSCYIKKEGKHLPAIRLFTFDFPRSLYNSEWFITPNEDKSASTGK